MSLTNNANRLRREVVTRLAGAFLSGNLVDEVDRIPFKMYPKSHDTYHCCIYKDRAITRSAIIAALGFLLEDDADDSIPLSDYARRAVVRKKAEAPIITVCDIACKGCVPARFFITNACQGCVARQCAGNCNFDAIRFENGRAQIDPAKCKNCGRCRDACPYQAITQLTVPCEKSCPVKAIHKNEEGRAEIDFAKCTSCGRCMRACPFTAVMERSQIIDVLRALASGRRVVALAAPAIVGQFKGSLGQVFAALRRLGFDDAVEVALGADKTAALEAKEFEERMRRGDRFMTTSCCPAYIETVRRHVNEVLPFVSDTKTPMHYSAEFEKTKDPDAVTVFIGPCVAKRYEGTTDPLVDYVLTFEELGSLFTAKGVDVARCEDLPLAAKPASDEARGFAITGGVAGAVRKKSSGETAVVPFCINGLSPQGVASLRAFAKGKCPGNLVEVMTCEGGCVGGAGVIGDRQRAAKTIEAFIGKQAEEKATESRRLIIPRKVDNLL